MKPRPIRAGTTPAPEDDRGFVIVGVVMFVLALTILGLSLFSLSSYESQFLNRSLAREQAFNQAWSGIERARYRLGSKGILDDVKGIVGTDSVRYAVAFQMQAGVPDSVGPMDPSKHVTIRVQTANENVTQRLEGDFQPNATQDYYRHLITARGVVNIGAAYPMTELTGDVWTNQPPIIMNGGSLAAGSAYTVRTSPAITLPDVATFIASQMAASPSPSPVSVDCSGPNPLYTLNGTFGGVKSFAWSGNECNVHGPFGFSFDEQNGTPGIQVHGICVLLLPHGFHTFSRVNITGSPGDALVIVAGRNAASPPTTNDAVFINTGLVTNIPVLFVTDSDVRIENNQLNLPGITAAYVSIYANNVFLGGPDSGLMRLIHNPSAFEDQANGLIEKLSLAGAVPNPPSVGAALSMVPGSWRQSSN